MSSSSSSSFLFSSSQSHSRTRNSKRQNSFHHSEIKNETILNQSDRNYPTFTINDDNVSNDINQLAPTSSLSTSLSVGGISNSIGIVNNPHNRYSLTDATNTIYQKPLHHTSTAKKSRISQPVNNMEIKNHSYNIYNNNDDSISTSTINNLIEEEQFSLQGLSNNISNTSVSSTSSSILSTDINEMCLEESQDEEMISNENPGLYSDLCQSNPSLRNIKVTIHHNTFVKSSLNESDNNNNNDDSSNQLGLLVPPVFDTISSSTIPLTRLSIHDNINPYKNQTSQNSQLDNRLNNNDKNNNKDHIAKNRNQVLDDDHLSREDKDQNSNSDDNEYNHQSMPRFHHQNSPQESELERKENLLDVNTITSPKNQNVIVSLVSDPINIQNNIPRLLTSSRWPVLPLSRSASLMVEYDSYYDIGSSCYNTLIHHNAILNQESLMIDPRYMTRTQTDLSFAMRSILLDWLIEVCDEYSLHIHTLYLTCSYLDAYLSKIHISRHKLQLVGMSALLIAAKYWEIRPPLIDELVYISDRTYNREDVLLMESHICNTLEWKLCRVTVWEFARRISLSLQMPGKTILFMDLLCELFLISEEYLLFPPYIIATSAAYLTLTTIYQTIPINYIKQSILSTAMTSITLMDIQSCVEELYFNHEKNYIAHILPGNGAGLGQSAKAVINKYLKEKYGQIAEIKPREEIWSLFFNTKPNHIN